MAILTILSPEEIRLFEHPPPFTAEERKRFFIVPKWTEEILATLQTPASQVGFLLLLGYFRATKKFYAPDTFAHADIVFAQRRLSLETTGMLEAYAKTTMHRHKILIRAKLGYRHYAPAAHAARPGRNERYANASSRYPSATTASQRSRKAGWPPL
jgi:hypothetical protein